MARELIVRIMESGGILGGSGPLLCFDDGTALPGQASVRVESRADAPVVVTVQFIVDGFDVRMEPSADTSARIPVG